MPELERRGARLWFEVAGRPDAPAILLLPALGTTADLWAPQLSPLGDRWRTIRCDTRGHGRSTASPPPYSLELLVDDALAVLDAAGAHRAHLCGVSLGGQVALALALQAPERVHGLVLAATAARIGTPALWNERIRAVLAGGLGPQADAAAVRWFTEAFRRREAATVAAFQTGLRRSSPDGYAGCCAALRDADLVPHLAAVRAPTLVVVAEADQATPPALGLELRDGIPDARLLALPGAHLVNVESAAPFTAAVRDFLASVEG